MVLLFGVSHRSMAAAVVVVQAEYILYMYVCGCSALYVIVGFLQLCNGQNHSLACTLSFSCSPRFSALVLYTEKNLLLECVRSMYGCTMYMCVYVWHHRSQPYICIG